MPLTEEPEDRRCGDEDGEVVEFRPPVTAAAKGDECPKKLNEK